MNHYLITLVFRIEAAPERVAQFDEQMRLIKADSATAAYEKACYLGLSEEGPVNNINGTVLEWKFVGIAGLVEIKHLSDKAEIFSNTRETVLPQAYMDHIKEKQQALILSLNQYNNGEVSLAS